MPVVEHLMRPGNGTIKLVPDVPIHVTEQIREWVDETNAGPGAHIVVTPSRVDPAAVGDAAVLAAALYAGPIVARRSRFELEFVGNATWLDTFLDADLTNTSATPAAWITSLARNGITAGTDAGGGNLVTRTFPAYSILAREALDTVALLGEWEYEFRPDFTIDYGSAANLFRQAGDYGTVVATATQQGPDAALRGVEGSLVDQALAELGPMIPTAGVSVVGGFGGSATATASTTRTLSLKTPTGGTPTIVTVFNNPSEELDNAYLSSARLLDLQGNRREIRVQSETAGLRRLMRPGDEVYAYDLPGGLYVTAGQPVQFRGEQIAPMTVRLTSLVWPIDETYGVYVRSNTSTAEYVDVSTFVAAEPATAYWTIGDWKPDISSTNRSSVLLEQTSYVESVGGWQSFTPVWNNLTVGDASVNAGQWRYESGSAHVRIRLVWGSTTSASGVVSVDMPASLAGRNDVVPSLGVVRVDDATGNEGVGAARVGPGDTSIGLAAEAGDITATGPFTWTTGDVIEVDIVVALGDPTPVVIVTELDNATATDVSGQVFSIDVTVESSSVVVVGSHIRRTGSGSVTALAPVAMTNVGSFSTLQASTVYDSGGVSNGAVALFQATATGAGTASETIQNDHQQSAVSLPNGASVAQSKLVTGTTDSVSASLNSAPSNTVYAMLFTGGQQTTITEPAVPTGWQKLAWDERSCSSGYRVRAGIYRGRAQTFSITLPTGATTNGGWGVLLFEATT